MDTGTIVNYLAVSVSGLGGVANDGRVILEDGTTNQTSHPRRVLLNMEIEIRQAKASESNVLTAISFASKRYWHYPEEYFDIWKKELTITPEYIQDNTVFVAEVDGKITGYFSIVEVKEDYWTGNVVVRKGNWLEHLFILPEFIGKRIGLELMSYAKEVCRKKDINRLLIFSDPNAKGFYDKIGAKYIEESPSSIEGRNVLFFELSYN